MKNIESFYYDNNRTMHKKRNEDDTSRNNYNLENWTRSIFALLRLVDRIMNKSKMFSNIFLGI